MRPPDQVRLEYTREWVRKAEADFLIACHLLAEGPEYLEGTVFHAQQAAEKYIKALLVLRQIEFSKTHDIEALLRLAGRADPELAALLAEATALTPYGVEYRYPGDYPEVTAAAGERAVSLTRRVRDEVRKRLPSDVSK